MAVSESSGAVPARLAAMEQEHADLEARLADRPWRPTPPSCAVSPPATGSSSRSSPAAPPARLRGDPPSARELLTDATGDERPHARGRGRRDAALAVVAGELRELMVPPTRTPGGT